MSPRALILSQVLPCGPAFIAELERGDHILQVKIEFVFVQCLYLDVDTFVSRIV